MKSMKEKENKKPPDKKKHDSGRYIERLMTPREVAIRMNCSVSSVFRQNDLGKMPPCIRIGRLLRWEAADIDELIRKKKQESAENLERSKNEKKVFI